MSGVIASAVAIGRQVAAQYRVDTYTIRRATSTPDGEGGGTDAESTEESGGCILTAGATRPEERAYADRITGSVPIIVRNMPWNTSLKASDVLEVNGRRLNVLGVLRAEGANAAVTAVCEEVG